jgi:flagellin-like hook-associated protein FlgL
MANSLRPHTVGQTILRSLNKATERGTVLTERLATGLRINRASDDAAALAIATDLTTKSRLYGQAVRNISDGISLLNVAESALSAITEITSRIQELANQAANGAYSANQRIALDKEAQALLGEIERIGSTSEYNGIQVLVGLNLTLQVGATSADTIRLDLSAISTSFGAASNGGQGTFSTINTFTGGGSLNGGGVALGDFNSDGILDVVQAVNANNIGTTFGLMRGLGDGQFGAPSVFGAQVTGPAGPLIADLNGDNNLDVVIIGGGHQARNTQLP